MRTNDLGIDARRSLTGTRITEVSRWRCRDKNFALPVARSEAIRPAQHIIELDNTLAKNLAQIIELAEVSEAAPLLAENEFGPVTAETASPRDPILAGWVLRPRS